jgi:biopolymer transport protein ExbD
MPPVVKEAPPAMKETPHVKETPPVVKPAAPAPPPKAAPTAPPQPVASAPRAADKDELIRQDKEAVRRQEQARRDALIQKDKEAVRGKTVPDGSSARVGITTRPSAPAKSAPTRDQSKLAMERLFAGSIIPEGKGTRRAPHRRAAGGEAGVNLSVFITPMLDMAFQLLAFFIVTYHPSALERHIDGTLLPPANIAIQGKKDDKNATPVDTPPDDKDTVVVQVKAVKQLEGKRREGELSQIYLKTKEDANPELIVDSDQDLESGLKKLRDRLKTLQEKGGKANINIAADTNLKHEFFIRVYDVCKAAKFDNVGFVAPADAITKKGS